MSTTPEHDHINDDVRAAERHEAVQDAVIVLAKACDGRDVSVLLEALARFLALLVVSTVKGRPGIDAFVELFTDELQAEWLQQQALRQQATAAGSQVN